ncbi:MAG: hypothetical protein K2W82_01930 [Candidatus Obscuribacterales bacterium]|nr:hypothetical protein [Candidatus Obscuribacterales bacterium]
MQGSETVAAVLPRRDHRAQSSNYVKDRTSTFKHNNIHDDLLLPGSPSVAEYIQNEKIKQLNKLREWHTECEISSTDLVELRSNFNNVRDFESKKTYCPSEEMRINPLYIAGLVPVILLITSLLFIHF